MQTLYIYDAVNYQKHIDKRVKLKKHIAQFSAETNEQCESLACDYIHSDDYAASYTQWYRD